MINHVNNILLQQIILDNSSFAFKEVVPFYELNSDPQALIRYEDGRLLWSPIDLSLNIIVNNKFIDTDIYYAGGRIGLGRYPLFNYRVDLAIPKNTIITALHIGDGSFGFSMGNGTSQGFIPEIIGVGSDENDTGLYFVGIAGNDSSSNIPLIILDGRNAYNAKLTNRPILGITSANYNEYSVSIDASDNLNVKEEIIAKDLRFKDYNNISLLGIIRDLQEQINDLKTKIT